MNEYIEREAAKQILEEHLTEIARGVEADESPVVKGYLLAKEHAIEYINGIEAADVVEVVRCRDCKNRKPRETMWCSRDNLYHNADDFCSYAEREK